ncbi:hypothetical protein [Oxalicibacterium faecigallinarum]|nr:hypothetical protein [Oxalicibacterium faecigallinarum]
MLIDILLRKRRCLIKQFRSLHFMPKSMFSSDAEFSIKTSFTNRSAMYAIAPDRTNFARIVQSHRHAQAFNEKEILMKKTAQAAALVSALFFSAGVMAQSSNDVVTKPAPSTESKPPVAHPEKTRGEVKHEAQGGSVGTLKPNSDESKPPASAGMKTKSEARHDDAKATKKGTTPDGINEPDNAYPNKTTKNK